MCVPHLAVYLGYTTLRLFLLRKKINLNYNPVQPAEHIYVIVSINLSFSPELEALHFG